MVKSMKRFLLLLLLASVVVLTPQNDVSASVATTYTLGCYDRELLGGGFYEHEVWGPGPWIAPHHSWQTNWCSSEHAKQEMN